MLIDNRPNCMKRVVVGILWLVGKHAFNTTLKTQNRVRPASSDLDL